MYYSSDQAAALTNCTFSGNNVSGGLRIYEGPVVLTGCTFTGNVAVDYGGAVAGARSLVVRDCVFSNNSAAQGGALSCARATTVANCVFSGNEVSGS